MAADLERGILLLQQRRPDLALETFRRALAEDPQDGHAHAWLALCLAARGDLPGAEGAAREAVVLAPEEPVCHFALGRVLLDAGRPGEGEAAAREAIRLDAGHDAYRSLLAEALLRQGRWAEALAAAGEALAIDPEDETALNLRSVALRQLGRLAEAGEGLEEALARDPESASTHANLGWSRLHEGRPREAIAAFREALRLDPALEFAREGLVEALKAKNPVYRMILRYFLWMSRLSQGARWGVILGLYLLFRLLGSVARSNPAAEPYVLPLLIAYGVFVFLSWTAVPLFNLTLRLSRDGRHALSDAERRQANAVGLLLLLGIAGAAGGALMDRGWVLWFGIAFLVSVIPFSVAFDPGRPRVRRGFLAYAVLLLLAGTLGALAKGLLPEGHPLGPAGNLLVWGCLLGAAACTWVSNIASGRRRG